jgi:two-component system, chemotaxis family, chemotaxis protein CheY
MVTVTILIIEDEPHIRSIITEILEYEGYPVVSAGNGIEALAYLRQQAVLPRLILLDLGMPVMTGWEFREEQQRDPRLAHIPVIIMSATIQLDRTAAALNATGYLDKPVDIHSLLSNVARYYG